MGIFVVTVTLLSSCSSGGGGGGGTGQQASSHSSPSSTSKWLDASGNLYLADTQNNRIRKIDGTTGKISTIAGTGTCGYSGDGGLASAAKVCLPMDLAIDHTGNLFFADYTNNVIRRIDATTKNISTVVGKGTQGYTGDGGTATSAELNSPNSIAVDASGNLYVADGGNLVIRKVDATTGHISTIAGTGASGYSGDGGAATNAKLGYWVTGLSLDSSDNLYFSDTLNHVVRRIGAGTGGNISTVAGSGTSGSSGDGGAATSAKFSYPVGTLLDASGNLYIADFGNYVIRKVDATTGHISTVVGDGTQGSSGDGAAAVSAELTAPGGLAIDAQGNIYFSDSCVIRKVNATTGKISTVGGNGTCSYLGDGGAATSGELKNPFDLGA